MGVFVWGGVCDCVSVSMSVGGCERLCTCGWVCVFVCVTMSGIGVLSGTVRLSPWLVNVPSNAGAVPYCVRVHIAWSCR